MKKMCKKKKKVESIYSFNRYSQNTSVGQGLYETLEYHSSKTNMFFVLSHDPSLKGNQSQGTGSPRQMLRIRFERHFGP